MYATNSSTSLQFFEIAKDSAPAVAINSSALFISHDMHAWNKAPMLSIHWNMFFVHHRPHNWRWTVHCPMCGQPFIYCVCGFSHTSHHCFPAMNCGCFGYCRCHHHNHCRCVGSCHCHGHHNRSCHCRRRPCICRNNNLELVYIFLRLLCERGDCR